MYSRRALGTVTDPSAFWQFSRIATRVRPTARPEPFRVCTASGLPFSLRNRACMRRAWNASKLEHEEISRYAFCDGSQKIGRASCRERVKGWGGGEGGVKEKSGKREE